LLRQVEGSCSCSPEAGSAERAAGRERKCEAGWVASYGKRAIRDRGGIGYGVEYKTPSLRPKRGLGRWLHGRVPDAGYRPSFRKGLPRGTNEGLAQSLLDDLADTI
jgi:hypothetical protein